MKEVSRTSGGYIPPVSGKKEKKQEYPLYLAQLSKPLSKGIEAAEGTQAKGHSLPELIGMLAQMLGEYENEVLAQSSKRLADEIKIGSQTAKGVAEEKAKIDAAIKRREKMRKKRKKAWGLFKGGGRLIVDSHNPFTKGGRHKIKADAQLIRDDSTTYKILAGMNAGAACSPSRDKETGEAIELALSDEKTMRYVNLALLAMTCVACPAMAPAALAIFALEETGGMDKMTSGVSEKYRPYVKMAIIIGIAAAGAGVSAGATKAVEEKAAAQAAKEAAEESVKGAAKEGAEETVLSQKSIAAKIFKSSFYGGVAMEEASFHTLTEALVAGGLVSKDDKKALLIINSIETLICVLAMGYSASKSVEGMSELYGQSRYMYMYSKVQQMMAIPMAVLGISTAFFQVGQGVEKLEQAAEMRSLAVAQAGIEIYKKAFMQTQSGSKGISDDMKAAVKAVDAMVGALPDMLAGAREAARILS